MLTETPIKAVAARLNAASLAIVSVSPEIRYPWRDNSRKGGHLVLLHGRDAAGVWFHNPSGIGDQQAGVHLPYERFAQFYAQRGMVLTRPAC